MKKNFFSILLTISMLCTFIPITASAENGTKYGDYLYYEINSDNTEVTITDCDNSVTEAVIPSEIDGLPVTQIGESAFAYCTGLTSVTVPEGVTSINNEAFRYCTSLTNITIPDGVTYIGGYAFYNCESLTSVTIPESVTDIEYWAFCSCGSLTSITIPDSVTNIDEGAFNSCSSLTSVNIPKGVTSIANSTFNNCSSLTDITIHEGIKQIGSYSFGNCNSLTSITIPYSVTDIDSCAFTNCSNLTDITVDENNTAYSSSDGVLYNKDKTELIQYPCGNGRTEFTIPDTVTSIAANAFNGCVNLINVTIPDSVTNIGVSAFFECDGLKNITVDENNNNYSSVHGVLYNKDKTVLIRYPIGNERTEFTIPDTVTEIDGSAFINCTVLISITIPENVAKIGDGAFYGCSSLTSITIPNGITKIDDYLFYNCSSLTSITIPDNVTQIGNAAFSGCSSLKSITIPDGVRNIGSYVFNACSDLTSITVGENNNNYVSSDGVLYNKNKTELIQYPVGNTRTEFVIPDSVNKINEFAFYKCTDLTSITIPKNVTYISRYAFYDCSGLKDIYFTGIKSEWNNIYIGLYNNELKNAAIHCIGPLPITTAEITKSETETEYTFDVNAQEKYEDCCVYAAVYDENGVLIEVNCVPMNTAENTNISVDKNDSGKTVKVFLWTDRLQSIIEKAKEFEI